MATRAVASQSECAALTTGKRLEIACPMRSASAGQMRLALRAYLDEQALDAAVAGQVVLAADEAFVNALTHAGGSGAISLTACVSEREARIEVRDQGNGFTRNGACHRRAVPDVSAQHGRGLFLIERLMDEVSVESGSSGTTVRMVKRLA